MTEVVEKYLGEIFRNFSPSFWAGFLAVFAYWEASKRSRGDSAWGSVFNEPILNYTDFESVLSRMLVGDLIFIFLLLTLGYFLFRKAVIAITSRIIEKPTIKSTYSSLFDDLKLALRNSKELPDPLLISVTSRADRGERQLSFLRSMGVFSSVVLFGVFPISIQSGSYVDISIVVGLVAATYYFALTFSVKFLEYKLPSMVVRDAKLGLLSLRVLESIEL